MNNKSEIDNLNDVDDFDEKDSTVRDEELFFETPLNARASLAENDPPPPPGSGGKRFNTENDEA